MRSGRPHNLSVIISRSTVMQTDVILIENARIFTPAPSRERSLLCVGGKLLKIGNIDKESVKRLDVPFEILDANDSLLVPGFIDPHSHLLGGSGEGSFADESPQIFFKEIVEAGITTVVGVLGVDTTMKTIPGLLSRVKALALTGITTRMWSGGYNIPPASILPTIRQDILFIEEVIGAGEIAVSDRRSLRPDAAALSRIVRDTFIGGHISGKAGLTHLHIGEEETRLAPLFEIIEDYGIEPGWLYPTHVERNEALLKEAVKIAKLGSTVDMDAVEGELSRWVRQYLEFGGPRDKLTLSSDSDSTSPEKLLSEFRSVVFEEVLPLEEALTLVTTNTANVLKLSNKGQISSGYDADLLLLERGNLSLKTVIAKGKVVVRDGKAVVHEKFIDKSERIAGFRGAKAPAN